MHTITTESCGESGKFYFKKTRYNVLSLADQYMDTDPEKIP